MCNYDRLRQGLPTMVADGIIRFVVERASRREVANILIIKLGDYRARRLCGGWGIRCAQGVVSLRG